MKLSPYLYGLGLLLLLVFILIISVFEEKWKPAVVAAVVGFISLVSAYYLEKIGM